MGVPGDAPMQVLAPVDLEGLKAVDVQDPDDVHAGGVLPNGLVHFVHQPASTEDRGREGKQGGPSRPTAAIPYAEPPVQHLSSKGAVPGDGMALVGTNQSKSLA